MTTSLLQSKLSSLAPLAGASLTKQALLVICGSLFLAALSQVAVGGPVPMTLQTLGVMLIGLTFGLRLGTATLVAYLLEGLAGLPFFAKFSSGIATFAGPSGGYLVGFLLAVMVMGYLADRGFTKGWTGTIIACLIGEVILFALGVVWLGHVLGFEHALEYGLTPFILGDAIKVALAALLGKGVLKGAENFAKM